MIQTRLRAAALAGLALLGGASAAQTLTLKDAINNGLANYATIKAKENYANASKAMVRETRREYLPNLVVSAQQDYGTVNGQNGPLYGFGGFGVASSGLPLPNQNWNAGFGALYLANVNWDFFTFGRVRERIRVAQTTAQRDENDLAQEKFQHGVRVAAAYLNLLAAQRITRSQEKNLERATVVLNNTVARAKTGLIAGVDSSLASAEVSGARIALIKARDLEQEQANRLGILMGTTATGFVLDTTFITRIPQAILEPATLKTHPLLDYYRSRVDISHAQLRYYNRFYFPTFTLVGVFQERGSGFRSTYSIDQTTYTSDYATGVNPVRANYLLGVGLNWNLTSIARNSAQVRAQRYILQGMQNEYDLADLQLKSQLALADAKVKNALDSYHEAPVQVKAANDAYLQKTALYRNGLANIVEVTQTLYALNRAETDRDIAYTNVWQALLLRLAAAGSLEPLIKEF